MKVNVLAYREEEVGEGALLVETTTPARKYWCVAQSGKSYHERIVGRCVSGFFEVRFGSVRGLRTRESATVEVTPSPLTGDNIRAVGRLRRRDESRESDDGPPVFYVESIFDVFTDFEADGYKCDLEEGR